MPEQTDAQPERRACFVCGEIVTPTQDAPYREQGIAACQVVLDPQGNLVKTGEWHWVAHSRCLG